MPNLGIHGPSRLAFVTAALFLLWGGMAAQACDGGDACFLDDRSYHLRLPDNWDGTTPLPVLLHFHGWGRSGAEVLRNGRIVTQGVAEDVLVLAPNGRNNSWSFRQAGSVDVTFARAVIADAAQRYPIDQSKIFVSGYSWGANMAWRFACEDGDGMAALLAVAGSLSQNETCETAPNEVRQVYGLTDNVLDFPMGPGDDDTYPVALWRRILGCKADHVGASEGPWNARSFLTFERTSWDCPSGRVVLDLHPGGHFIPHDWIPLQVSAILDQD
jgi:polyhydroxybutyrate depolymerase